MIRKFISAAKYLARLSEPGWDLKVWPDDTFLVSYPKSGNTWLRFLVANFVQADPAVTLLDADKMIPSVHGRAKKHFNAMLPPRIIKSHYPFHPAYRRVVYVVRDPRDVVMSQYHYQIKRGVLEPGASVQPFVSRFLAGDVCPYGSWGEHVGSWLAARKQDPNFLLVRYEDMLKQIDEEATRVARFIDLPMDPERIAQAIERSSVESMRNLEKVEGKQWASTKGTRQEMNFFRSGKSGEGRAVLPRECIEEIEKAWGALMCSLNYELAVAEKSPASRPVLAQS